MKMPEFSTTLVLLIGLGVGIDYALFIVTRHRQGLIAGRDVERRSSTPVNTSGRAVLFAGIIVCIAPLGMFALGVSFLYGLAVAAALGVALTMIAALTLLPALLGFIGPRVLSRRQKANLAKNGPRIVGTGTKGFWPRWADIVRRRPALPAAVALVLIVVIALALLLAAAGVGRPGQRSGGVHDRARPTTCWRRASVRGSTGHSSSSPSCTTAPKTVHPTGSSPQSGPASPAWPGWRRRC